MPNNLQAIGSLAGRVLLALIFVMSGVSKIGSYEATVDYMQSYGLPGSPAAIYYRPGRAWRFGRSGRLAESASGALARRVLDYQRGDISFKLRGSKPDNSFHEKRGHRGRPSNVGGERAWANCPDFCRPRTRQYPFGFVACRLMYSARKGLD